MASERGFSSLVMVLRMRRCATRSDCVIMEYRDSPGDPKPRKIFVFLVSSSMFIAVILISLGLTAFTFTPSYRAGNFWTGFLMLTNGVYNIAWLCIRLFCDSKGFIRRHKRKLGVVSSMLSGVCFTACMIGAILDIMAAFLLQRTDFTQCAYTSNATTVFCTSPVCPNLEIQARTCYCCYLYNYHTKGGCNTPLLLAKQTYFSGVESCSAITSTLQPMLSVMGGLNLLAAIISMVYIFQSNPILYHKQRDSKPPSTHSSNNGLRILYTIKTMAGTLLGHTKQFKNVAGTETTNTNIDNN